MLREHRPRFRLRHTCRSAPLGFLPGRKRVFLSGAHVGAIRHGLEGGDEVVFAIADQVCSSHGFQSFAQQGPIVGIVVAQKGFVEAAAFVAFDDVDAF